MLNNMPIRNITIGTRIAKLNNPFGVTALTGLTV
jgi:hypothetical protein